MKIKYFIFLLVFFSSNAFAQTLSQQDITLYLHFDEEHHYKRVNSKDFDPITKELISVVRYIFENSNLYEGYPLEFVSEKKDLIDTIAIHQLDNYQVVTLKDLRKFIGENYRKAYIGYDGSDYFDGLKHISG